MEAVRSLSIPLLRGTGWAYEGEVPTVPKYVATMAPHTSNWDGLILVGLLQSQGIEMSWMIKNDWVKGPLGAVLRPLGAVAIDRSGRHNVVQQMVARFAERDAFALGIPPEGTRKRAPYWRSGFYHIAVGAKVPVVPGYLDYARKRGGLGAPIVMTGDVHRDMDAIRAFYADKAPVAAVPEKFGPIRLREEDA